MAQLPWELEEEILSRLPPRSLVRFRSVCKQWNSVFNDKSFLNNHMSRSRPQFIFQTKSKVYSIDIIDHNSIDPTKELRELPSSDIPYDDKNLNCSTITTCDELLFYKYRGGRNKTAVWNPWLRQVKWIEHNKEFNVVGLGYDNSRRPEKVYKMLVWFFGYAIYDCASHAFKFIDRPDHEGWPITETAKRSHVSLNGNLYWLTFNLQTPHEYFIRSFDFSTNLPSLFHEFYRRISYFIYDKTIFMCCGDGETGVACIYVVREDLCKKIPIGSGIGNCCHSVYIPNLISVPSFRS